MKYAIDKIEEDIVILENLETKEKEAVNIKNILGETHEGAIVIKNNDTYITDSEEENLRRKMLREKLERLKNKQS